MPPTPSSRRPFLSESTLKSTEVLISSDTRSPSTIVRAALAAMNRALGDGRGQAHARLTLTAVAVILASPFYYFLTGRNSFASLFAFATSLATLFSLIWLRLRGSRLARALVLISMSTALASFFFATQAVTAHRRPTLKDPELLAVDSALLGWIFPDGQLALLVDRSSVLGPETPLGRVFSDVLMLCYFSYYIWPYILILLHLGQVYLCVRRGQKNSEADAWVRVECFVSAWAFGFMTTFAVNTLCPAESPRLFLKSRYTTKLQGLPALLSPVTNQDNTWGSFPSGHVGETLITGFSALLLPPTLIPWYGKLVSVIGTGITIATLWLRYHYAIDALSTVPVLLAALAWGLMLPRANRQQLLDDAVKEAEDERSIALRTADSESGSEGEPSSWARHGELSV